MLLRTFAVLILIATGAGKARGEDRPNVVFFIADDLGYGDLGCYGQKKIRTPNVDRLAAEGMRFANYYSGHNVCAPSRCVLMTGKHPGHAYIRDNRQAKGFPEGQEPVPADYLQLPLGLKKAGYTLGGFGKWGLGPFGSTGDPLKQGFDRWFGYNCQAVAHNYYPTYLWDDGRKIPLKNAAFSAHQKLPADADPKAEASYAGYTGVEYAPDRIAQQALKFVADNKDRPFFLYYPTTVPHLALQVPEDSLKEYAGTFPETPYTGDRGYLPHRQPRAAYAAMVTRMDREVGKLMALLQELKLDEKTIFVFTSDNGPLYDRLGGTDEEFFASAGGFRGRKGSYFEGGMKVPAIVRWKGKIQPGSQSDRVCGFEDFLPTLFDCLSISAAISKDIDGVSFLPTLLGKAQPAREFLYRESPGYGGQQCIRVGDWKAIRQGLNPGPKAAKLPNTKIELYNLANDPGESRDVAEGNREIVEKLGKMLVQQHVKSEQFPIRGLDGK